MVLRRPERAAVFIDGGYLKAILRDYFRSARIDFLKLSNELCGGYERFRSYYYICPPYQSDSPTYEEQMRKSEMDQFLYNIRRLPRFEVRLGRLRRTGDLSRPFEQKGIDVLLSIDLTQLAVSRIIDQAILVSGDSDFCPSVRVAKENMVLVKLVYHSGQVNEELFNLCDERVPIDKGMIDRIQM